MKWELRRKVTLPSRSLPSRVPAVPDLTRAVAQAPAPRHAAARAARMNRLALGTNVQGLGRGGQHLQVAVD